jgi:hypothetical protein
MASEVPLTRIERLALRFAEVANDDPRGKWLQTRFLRGSRTCGCERFSPAGCSPTGSTA